MAQTEYPGLCRSCMHSDICVLTRGMNFFPVYCEEFQPEIPAARLLSRSELSNDSRLFNSEDSAGQQGLCCDCGNRHTCTTVSDPEGGVWYCEEYI